jgi:hypothetical protein
MASAKKTSSQTSKQSKVGSPMKRKSSQSSNSPNKKQSSSPKKSTTTKNSQRTRTKSKHPTYQRMVTEALTTVNYLNTK